MKITAVRTHILQAKLSQPFLFAGLVQHPHRDGFAAR